MKINRNANIKCSLCTIITLYYIQPFRLNVRALFEICFRVNENEKEKKLKKIISLYVEKQSENRATKIDMNVEYQSCEPLHLLIRNNNL